MKYMKYIFMYMIMKMKWSSQCIDNLRKYFFILKKKEKNATWGIQNHVSSVKIRVLLYQLSCEALIIDEHSLPDRHTYVWATWTFNSSQINFRLFWNSRPTWCLIHEFTSLWLHMHLSSLLRRPTMSNSVWLRSPMLASNQQTRWLSVILVMASTWRAVCCIEVMLYPKMSMLPLPPSRLRGLFSLWTGAQLDLRLVKI